MPALSFADRAMSRSPGIVTFKSARWSIALAALLGVMPVAHDLVSRFRGGSMIALIKKSALA